MRDSNTTGLTCGLLCFLATDSLLSELPNFSLKEPRSIAVDFDYHKGFKWKDFWIAAFQIQRRPSVPLTLRFLRNYCFLFSQG